MSKFIPINSELLVKKQRTTAYVMASPLQPVFFKIKRSYVIDSTWVLFHLKIHQQRGFEPNFGNFDTIIPLSQWETLHSSVIGQFPELEYQQYQLIYNGKIIICNKSEKLQNFKLFIFD